MVKQWKLRDILTPEDIQRLEDGVARADANNQNLSQQLNTHKADRSNPHNVTATQVGAYTKAEADTKIADAITVVQTDLNTFKSLKNNPHGVTATQVGAYSKTEADTLLANTLSDSHSYADTKKTESLSYTDSEISKAKTAIIASNVASASKLANARLINGVPFDGTKDISLSPSNIGTFTKVEIDTKDTAILSSAKMYADNKKTEIISYTDTQINNAKSELTSGSVASAEKLSTARLINGVEFDGTEDITLTAGAIGTYTKEEIDANVAASSSAVQANLDAFKALKNNPHNVTAAQVGTYTKTEIDSKDTAMLTSAKTYADTKKAEANSYTDTSVSNAKTAIIASNVASASKLATPRRIAGVEFDGTKDITIPANNVGAYTKAESNSNDASTLSSAKTYADEQDAANLVNAKDYADAQDVTNLTSAKSYTDSQVSNAKTSIISGNVASASKLATARTIAGVLFDGSANISIGAGNVGAYTKSETDTKDTSILASAKTYADSQIAAAKSTIIAGNVASASKLAATRLINGVEFDGSKDISLSTDNIGTYNKSTIDSKDAGILSSSKSYTDTSVNNAKASIVAGNVATATKLQTARTIAGVLFDGSANISIGPSNVGTYSQSDINAKDTSTLNNAKSYADTKKNEAVSYTNSQVTDLKNHLIFVGTEAQWNALGTTEQNKYILKAIVE